MTTNGPIISGYLLKMGGTLVFKNWSRRYFELREDGLHYSVIKGGIKAGYFRLVPQTLYEDSSVRHFCFCLIDPQGETLYLAAENGANKEAWSEKIQLTLMQLRLAQHRKLRNEVSRSEVVNVYQNRPNLYVKIVKARNLLGQDNGGTSDPYVNVCVGSSTAKTTTRKKTSNPEWGMVFNFDWDKSSRYMKIDIWDEDFATADDFLGMILFPLLPLRDGYNHTGWYQLEKRSHRSHVLGDILIEVSCSGDPSPNHSVWHFFRHIRMLPEFTTKLLPRSDPNWSSLPDGGFPFSFPPLQTEVVEDISVRVVMSCVTTSHKLQCSGIIILTNYRLIFVALQRINTLCSKPSVKQMIRNIIGNSIIDLTMQVPLGSITQVSLSTENDNAMNSTPYEVIKIQTCDNKKISFAFREHIEYTAAMESESQTPQFEESSYCHAMTADDSRESTSNTTTTNTSTTTAAESTIDDFEAAWIQFIQEPAHDIDACDSDEGPVAQRLHYRLLQFLTNRESEQWKLIRIHQPLIEPIFKRMARIDHSVRYTSEFDEDLHEGQLPMGWSSDHNNKPARDNFEKIEQLFSLSNYQRAIEAIPEESFKSLFQMLEATWTVYNPYHEFRRFGVPDWLWQLSTMNDTYDLCPTYPKVLVMPTSLDDEDIAGSAAFRSKGRFPTMVWRHMSNNCSISRCSQPLVGIIQNRSTHDEKVVDSFNKNGGAYAKARYMSMEDDIKGKPIVIVDARPLLNATANQAAGKGFESEKCYENASILFMDIVNIHAVRKSLEMVGEACADEINWLRNLDASGWLTHLRKILHACLKIVHSVAFDQMSVMVHCSDGWDRTSQLTSISMLLLDPFYRTLKGFITLIEKEWISFGHKFADRLGWTRYGWRDEERSDIFLQFLDCVHQIIVQHPNAFEFKATLLIYLAEHLHSGWFGNFMFNCEREYLQHRLLTVPIWAVILHDRDRFVNPAFTAVTAPLIPVISQQRIVIWSDLFLRWNDRIWESAWKNDVRDKFNREQESVIPFAFWADDKNVRGCKRCAKKFTVLRRKHHCRVCGHIFCEQCASEMKLIPQISKWRMSRCCIDCARRFDADERDKRMSVMVNHHGLDSSGLMSSNNSMIMTRDRSNTKTSSIRDNISIIDNNENSSRDSFMFGVVSEAMSSNLSHHDADEIELDMEGRGAGNTLRRSYSMSAFPDTSSRNNNNSNNSGSGNLERKKSGLNISDMLEPYSSKS